MPFIALRICSLFIASLNICYYTLGRTYGTLGYFRLHWATKCSLLWSWNSVFWFGN